jgi:hypothetical protein
LAKRIGMDRPSLRVSAAVLGASDANVLAAFYERLLGWLFGEPPT